MKNGSSIIKKEELKFWLAMMGIVVTGAVTFTRLQDQVDAMVSREQANRTAFYTQVEILSEVRDTVTRLESNQILLMEAFNLEPIR